MRGSSKSEFRLAKGPFVYWDVSEVESGVVLPVLESREQPGWTLAKEFRVTREEDSQKAFRKIAKLATVAESTFGFGILQRNPFFSTVGMYRKAEKVSTPTVDFLDEDDNPMEPIYVVDKAA